MTNEDYLGEFEHLVLLGILRLGDEAYGARIREEIVERAARDVSFGALYSALRRLERKGLISGTERLGENSTGRPRRYFAASSSGLAAVRRSQTRLARMAEGVQIPSEAG